MLGNIRTQEGGFTIVEMTVAITAGSLVALTVLSISLFFFADVMRANSQTQLLAESQVALSRMVEDMRTGSAILLSNTITDANEPAGGWTTSNTDLILIVATPSIDNANNFVFDASTGNPYQDEFIYFTDNDDHLHKRILANTAAPGNVAVTTCPAAVVTSSCPEDKLLTENFDNMTFSFFDRDNNPTVDPTAARSTEINIFMSKQVFGRMVTAENNIRMSLRNPQS